MTLLIFTSRVRTTAYLKCCLGRMSCDCCEPITDMVSRSVHWLNMQVTTCSANRSQTHTTALCTIIQTQTELTSSQLTASSNRRPLMPYEYSYKEGLRVNTDGPITI